LLSPGSLPTTHAARGVPRPANCRRLCEKWQIPRMREAHAKRDGCVRTLKEEDEMEKEDEEEEEEVGGTEDHGAEREAAARAGSAQGCMSSSGDGNDTWR
jgi:hypothetical protein